MGSFGSLARSITLGTGGGTWSPASIEALAQVLVADVRAETEPQEETEDKQ